MPILSAYLTRGRQPTSKSSSIAAKLWLETKTPAPGSDFTSERLTIVALRGNLLSMNTPTATALPDYSAPTKIAAREQ